MRLTMSVLPTPSRPTPTTDVVVVGGGLVACLTARALADEGLAVALVDRAARLGQESSSAAAGMLSPQMEAAEELLVTRGPAAALRRDAMLALCLAGRDRYRDFVR